MNNRGWISRMIKKKSVVMMYCVPHDKEGKLLHNYRV